PSAGSVRRTAHGGQTSGRAYQPGVVLNDQPRGDFPHIGLEPALRLEAGAEGTRDQEIRDRWKNAACEQHAIPRAHDQRDIARDGSENSAETREYLSAERRRIPKGARS